MNGKVVLITAVSSTMGNSRYGLREVRSGLAGEPRRNVFHGRDRAPKYESKSLERIGNLTSFASKNGINSLAFVLDGEPLEEGIVANEIAPIYETTPMLTKQLTEDARFAVIEKVSVRRYPVPKEFSNVVQSFASWFSVFIMAETIDSNGGLQFDREEKMICHAW